MRFSKTEPGVIVSGLAHVALLAATLVAFSDTKTFEDAQETVPVDVITGEQFNQITQGEKTAKDVLPKPAVQVQKQADVPEPKPRPPEVEAQKDVPTPPPPLKRIPDPGEDDQPKQAPAPTPPQKVAEQPPVPTPPVRPPPPPPTPEARPTPPPPEDAEAVEPPKPQPRPKDPKPEPKPEKAEITPPLPKVRPAPKEEPKPALDRTAIAKLLDQKASAEPKAASRPKSGDETTDQKPRMSTSEISRLLSKDAPSQRASTGREVSQTASIGAPTANAAHMSPSLWGQLDGMMQDQYKQCWSYLGLGAEARYVPQIRVQFQPDGRLSAEPALLNPPSDPGLRSLAESAMRAVRRCNPLKIPAQFAPYYDQWKGRILRFDPQEMQG